MFLSNLRTSGVTQSFNLPHLTPVEEQAIQADVGILPARILIENSLQPSTGLWRFVRDRWTQENNLGDSSAVLLGRIKSILAGRDKPSATLCVALAEAHYREGSPEKAKTALGVAETANPSAVEYCAISKGYRNLGDEAQAKRTLEAAERLSTSVKDYRQIAKAYRSIGMTSRSLEACDRAISLDAGDSKTYLERGLTFASAWKTQDAINDYEEALRLWPTNHKANLALGMIYRDDLDVINLKLSLTYFNRAIDLCAKPPAAYFYERSVLFYKTGNYAAALADVTEATQKDRTEPSYLADRGLLLEEMGDYEAAEKDYLKASTLLHRKDAVAFENLGRVNFRMNRHEEALSHFETSLGLDPNGSSRLFMYRGKAYVQLGRLEDALKDFDRSIALGHNGEAAYSRALIYMQRKQYDLAIKDLYYGVKIFFHRLDGRQEHTVDDLYALRAHAYLLSGQNETAIEHYEKTTTLHPSDAKAFHRYGIALRNMDRLDEAAAKFKRAHQLNRDQGILNPRLYLDIILLDRQRGETESALRRIRWLIEGMNGLGFGDSRLRLLAGIIFWEERAYEKAKQAVNQNCEEPWNALKAIIRRLAKQRIKQPTDVDIPGMIETIRSTPSNTMDQDHQVPVEKRGMWETWR